METRELDRIYTFVPGKTLFRVRRGNLGRVVPPTPEDLKYRGHAAGWYMQRYSDSLGHWQDQYFFAESEATHEDFDVLNWTVATDPKKLFYQVHLSLICQTFAAAHRQLLRSLRQNTATRVPRSMCQLTGLSRMSLNPTATTNT